jgi:hypothetical protein
VPIDNVISVACVKDLPVWRIAAPMILKHIAAVRYTLIVPPEDTASFRSATPPEFDIVSETCILVDAKQHLARRLAETKSAGRVGWYYQQLLKIAACASCDGERVLIWDADTIPLRRLKYFDESQRPIFYKGVERHGPYFGLIEHLLGLRRNVSFSFIAQSFPVRKSWLLDCLDAIEARSGTDWISAIIAGLDPDETSGFSEYETMGAFFVSSYRSEMKVTSARWHRRGNILVGGVDRLTDKKMKLLSRIYDYVSFESWDTSRYSALKCCWTILRSAFQRRTIKPIALLSR